jgi:hypothetical protein
MRSGTDRPGPVLCRQCARPCSAGSSRKGLVPSRDHANSIARRSSASGKARVRSPNSPRGPFRERRRRRRRRLIAYASEDQLCLQVVAAQAGSKHTGESRNHAAHSGTAGAARMMPVRKRMQGRACRRADGHVLPAPRLQQQRRRRGPFRMEAAVIVLAIAIAKVDDDDACRSRGLATANNDPAVENVALDGRR